MNVSKLVDIKEFVSLAGGLDLFSDLLFDVGMFPTRFSRIATKNSVKMKITISMMVRLWTRPFSMSDQCKTSNRVISKPQIA